MHFAHCLFYKTINYLNSFINPFIPTDPPKKMVFLPRGPQSGSFTFGRFRTTPRVLGGVFFNAKANRQIFATVSENRIQISCYVRKLQKFEKMASNKPAMKNIKNQASQRLIFSVLLLLWP